MVRDLTGKHPQYYEAILQLRDISQEVVDFVADEVQRGGMRISKTVKVSNGIDVYLTDKSLTKSLGKTLQTKFGGECSTSASIYGQKDGQEIYRLTVLFRGSSVRKGDAIEYQGEQYTIKMLGKDILLQNKKTGEKRHLKYKEMAKVKKI